LREENRFRVSGKRVLRRIFRPEREEVAGGWRRLHNEERHNLYASPDIIRMNPSMMRLSGRVARMGGMKNVYKILVGEPERARPLGRRRSR
jgi:hypothetical protein